MAIGETLNAKPATVADVFSDVRRYVVPPFQRDYSWEKDQWEELWADILALQGPDGVESDHYLGAIVLQPTGERAELRIIDGQQRLVTLSLLALAIIGWLTRLAEQGNERADNTERARILRESFVSRKDAASLQHRPRLRLNQRDNTFYANYLVQGKEPPRSGVLQGSERRMYDALKYFERQVEKRLTADGATLRGADLVQLLDDVVARRLRFIEIIVLNDETAFTVFETLNARGVALSTADLLKNYLFSVAATKGSQSDLDDAQQLWQRTLDLVPMDQLSTMLFHQLAATVVNLREKRVFSAIKQIVPRQRDVFDFLRDMGATAEVYAALDDPEAPLWTNFPGARAHVKVLRLLRVEQCRPLILAAMDRLVARPERLAQLLRNIVVISVRTTIARTNTGDVQRAYHQAAMRVSNGELKSPLQMANAVLAGLTVPDEAFAGYFARLELSPRGPRRALLRYLLSELEQGFGGQPIDFEATDATIEHILPENPATPWVNFSREDRERDVNRLGNLTPLEFSKNKGLGASPYARKREVYATSAYRLTSSISPVEWSRDAIRARQEQMAQRALAIWRIEGSEEEGWRIDGQETV